jgi:hypothetical protein
MKPVIRSLIKGKGKITAYFDFKDDDGNVLCSPPCIVAETEQEIFDKLKVKWLQFEEKNKKEISLKSSLESSINDFKKSLL